MASIKQKVGRKIKDARTGAGLTQKDAGERIGVSESTYNRYETGKQNLTVETLEKIAKALGTSLNITFDK